MPDATFATSPLLPPGFTLLQVTPGLDGGGVESATLDMAAAVARAGGRSLVASRGGALEGALAKAGAKLARLPVHARDPARLIVNAGRLAALIRRERVSLVHVRSRAPAFSALMAARACKVPIVATYHGVYSARSGLKRWYNSIMTRGDVVIANSRFTREHILEQHKTAPGKVIVIPEGIDTGRFNPAAVAPERIVAIRRAWGLAPSHPRRRIVLLAGRLTDWKGQRLMVEALGRMDAADDVLLVLAGKVESLAYVQAIEAAVAVAGLGDQVRMTGPLEDMPAAFAAADLVVAPSTQAESFGRTPVEAAAMERVVLASRLGALAETVEDGATGWLLPPGDVDAWAAGLRMALDTSATSLAAMGRAARLRATSRYDLEAMCQATFAVYRRLVSGAPGRGPA